MGYNARITDDSILIRKENFEKITQVLHEFITRDLEIRKVYSWFYNLNDYANLSGIEILKWIFNIDIDTNGNIYQFNYPYNHYDEDTFYTLFQALAPFIEPGDDPIGYAYVSWIGEDDEQWRFVIIHGEVFEDYPTITWSSALQFEPEHHFVKGAWIPKLPSRHSLTQT